MKREELFESIDKQIISEKVYRARIRKQINKFKVLKENKKRKELIIEKIFRAKIQKDLKTLVEKKNTRIHKSTGMNSLEDLFSNTNLLSVLEGDYYYLTTSSEQREDYKNHILSAVIDLFKNEDLSPDADEDGELNEAIRILYEQEDPDISITVTDEELPEDKIVGPARDEMDDEKEKEDNENAEAIDPDEDLTGRNRANNAISKIEKSITDAYNILGNPADKADFKTYLIANLRLYFSKWENALSNDANPEFSPDVDKAVEDAEADLGDEEGTEDAAPTEEEGGDDLDLEL